MTIDKDVFDDVLLGITGFLLGFVVMTLILEIASSTVVWMGEYQKQMIKDTYREIAAEQKAVMRGA
jgi:hypothetical protein